MDYQGYKLIDEIMLICRAEAEHEESYSRTSHEYLQAYLVDPSNKKQLESARYWAKWTEYGPQHRNEEGKWVRDWEIQHDPVEFTFANNGFELELKDCAGGSSQGGKLSFWNCLVSKDGNTFMIGINSDMLLNLLKNATFINGKCQDSLIFITQKGRVGMTTEGSETYQQCIKDKELLVTMKKKQTSKFTFGDKISTATINEAYLGTITKYYDLTIDHGDRYYQYDSKLRYCTLTKLKKPVTYHIFDGLYHGDILSEMLNSYDGSLYSYPDIKQSCPKRAITGKINIDCSEDEFKQRLMKMAYDYESCIEKLDNYFSGRSDSEEYNLYYFVNRHLFGFGFEPFEIDESLLQKLKSYGLKYIEE